MSFLTWLHQYPRWDTYGWLTIIAVGAYWEIMGAIYEDRTTFTHLVRDVVPVGWRMVILLVLIWHFCLAKANSGQKWWWF